MTSIRSFCLALFMACTLWACSKTLQGIVMQTSTLPQYQQSATVGAATLRATIADSVLILGMTGDTGYQKFYTKLAKPIIKEMKKRGIPATYKYDGPETREPDSRPLVTRLRQPIIFLHHANLKQIGEDPAKYDPLTIGDRNINNYTFSISIMDAGKTLWRRETPRLGIRDTAKDIPGLVKTLGEEMQGALQGALE